MKPPFRFGIVGGGLTATSMLCQLVGKARKAAAVGQLDPRRISLAVFERADSFGPGFPHNERYLMPFHITNMCAADMGVYVDRPGDFQAWVDRNLDRLRIRFRDFPAKAFVPIPGPAGCRHYPRAFMGEYLRFRFKEALEDARRSGMSIRLYPCHEVIDIRLEGGLVHIVEKEAGQGVNQELPFDAALLATGHWFSDSGLENYFDSPWPASRLHDQIPPGASVGVIGTSLSAIETALTLTSDGRFKGGAGRRLVYVASKNPRTITLYSRRGLLPRVRGKAGSYRNRFLTQAVVEKLLGQGGDRHHLEAVFRLLNMELESAYGRALDWAEVLDPSGSAADFLRRSLREAENGDGPQGEVLWQTVFFQTFGFVRQWYLELTEEERRGFDRTYASVFFTHAATQPRLNAAKLLALIESGHVRVLKLGHRYRFRRDERNGCYRFEYMDRDGHPRSDSYRYVVNARGQEKFLDTDPSELARNLIAKGWVQSVRLEAESPESETAKTATRGRPLEDRLLRAGSIRINPQTHQVETSASGEPAAELLYAVGAMTRGRIIDASMAHGLARSTATVADRILEKIILKQIG